MQYTELKSLIERCVAQNIPFAVYALPGSSDFCMLASHPDEDTGENIIDNDSAEGKVFRISPFNDDFPYPIGVKDSISPADLESLTYSYEDAEPRPVNKSTDRILHYAQVHEIVKSFKHQFDKVVLSRIISGEMVGEVSEIAGEYFEAFPDTFRYLYFTQETGLWMGASPELLLDYDYKSGALSTMSLAGTRKSEETSQEWDIKNIDEQDIVTAFIVRMLSQNDVTDVIFDDTEVLRWGNIEHRRTSIRGEYHGDPYKLLSALSPTPAVCGDPRNFALEKIYNYEVHPRRCYGGYIAVNDPATGRLHAFVNLRCAALWPEKDSNRIIYNIYAGGGLTQASVPETEWEETEAKSQSIRTIFERHSSHVEK